MSGLLSCCLAYPTIDKAPEVWQPIQSTSTELHVGNVALVQPSQRHSQSFRRHLAAHKPIRVHVSHLVSTMAP